MESCVEKIYGEDYRDYIVGYTGNRALIQVEFADDCIQYVSNQFAVVYKSPQQIVQGQGLKTALLIPRCFGLMNSEETLENSGITKVQRMESLGLFGQGILVGIVDTGAGV